MVRPTRRGRMRALLSSEEIDGVYTGDDVDFDSGVFTDVVSRDQWKQPVAAATTANVTIATALNAGDTIDGVTLAAGDRVLVKNQTTGSQNGIYIAGSSPERAADFDDDDDTLGAIVYVIAGTSNGGKAYRVSNTSAITIDTTSITWTEFGASGTTGFDPGWFNVEDYGAVHDGSTDDTTAIQDAIDAAAAAGGGVVYFPSGVYVVGGALQDTSRSNAQLLLPRIDAVDSEQVTIELRGEFPPPPIVSVIGTTPVPDGHSIIKGTLNTGAGGALIGAHGPSGTFEDFTNLLVRVQDLTFRMPSNPVLTACDFSKVTAVDLDNVIVDVGSYYVQGLTEPTTSSSVGIKLPVNNNGAYTRLGAVNVIGFYTGLEYSEHTVGEQVSAWGCKIGHKFLTATNHSSVFLRMQAVHCERVIQATGAHRVSIDQLNIEHAASGWWVTDYDIDDASNYLKGHLAWHVVLAGVGIDNTFTVNGATGMYRIQLGSNPYGSTSFATPSIALGTAAAAGAASTVIRSDATIAAFDATVPSTLNYGDSAATGSAAYAARRDHVHGMPAASTSTGSGVGDHEHMVDLFTGDGSTTAFELTDEPLDPEAVVAFVAGSETAVTLSGTMNTTATFGVAPSAAARIIVMYPAVSA